MLFSELVNVLKVKQLIVTAEIRQDARIDEIIELDRINQSGQSNVLYYLTKNSTHSSAGEGLVLPHAFIPQNNVKNPSDIALNFAIIEDKQMKAAIEETRHLLSKKASTNGYPYYPLFNSIVSMRDLADVFKEVHKRSGCALLAFDKDGKIIASSQKREDFDKAWTEAIAAHVLPKEKINLIQKTFGDNYLEHDTELIPAPQISQGTNFFIAAIGRDSAPEGYILVRSDRPKDHEKIEYYVPMLSHMCSNVVRQEELSHNLNPYLYRSLLADLMRQDILLDTKKHIASSGLTFPNCMAVLLLQPDPSMGKRFLHKDLPAMAAEILHNVPYVVSGDLVTLLVHLDDNAHFPKDVDEKLRDFIGKNKLKCGMSNAFFNPESFAKYYDQANKAMLYAKQLHRDRIINCYEDYCTYDIVFNLPEGTELSYFLHTSLVILKNIDQKNGSDLYKSLKVFTECGFNISKASKALYIHRNTFSYRKQQIEDLCGIDFDEPELNYKLKTAFVLDEIIQTQNGLKTE